MATTCAFSAGFSSGFDICVDEPTAPGGSGTGAGGLLLRRRIFVDLEGRGLIAVIGRGELSADRALAGTATVEVRGVGELSAVRALAAVARISHQGKGTLSAERVLAGAALLRSTAAALLTSDVGLGGTATLRVTATANLGVVSHVRVPVDLEGARLLVPVVAFGQLQCDSVCAGRASLSVTAAGDVSADCSLEGWVDFTVSAWGEVEADDESTALMLLGLPSDVLVWPTYTASHAPAHPIA